MNYRTILLGVLTLALTALPADAQRLRKRALQYVLADSVFVLPKDGHNIIMDIMEVAPFIGPRPIVVTKEDRKTAKHELDNGNKEDLPSASLSLTERTAHNARMLLLTGHSSYAELMEDAYFNRLPAALDDDGILPLSERTAAAQQLLDLTGTIFATDERGDVYVNFFENCVARIHTKRFRLLLDMISGYPEEPMVKLRIDGLDNPNARFALHIRVPSTGAPKRYFINGHEVIAPVYRDGYFVLDRQWRNGEEVYFILNRPEK